MTTNLLVSIFSPAQIAGIVIICIVAVALIGLNVLLWYLYRKGQERKLCSRQLQQKRDALLDHLEQLKMGGVIPTVEELEESDIVDEEEQDNDDVTDEEGESNEGAVILPTDADEGSGELAAEILAVKNMSATTREKLGFVGAEYDNKRYYVRYNLSFEAKLRLADDEVKDRYKAFCNEVALYKGVKIKGAFRQQRIYKGRKTLGLILFRGKTLCIAFALDPNEYIETKYRGIDKSDKKRFENTPMLFKLTSTRKLEYAKYLLLQLAEANTLVLSGQPVHNEYDLKRMTRDALYNAELLRLTVLGEVPDDVESTDEPEEILEEEIAPAAPAPVAEETEEDIDEDEEVEIVETEEGRMRYDRSFTARIVSASVEVKTFYSDLKNYLLDFKRVRSRVIWKMEKFRIGRTCIASLAIRGKTLCLYLAMNPQRFDDSKYKVEDYSLRSKNTQTPLLVRIKNARRLKLAKELIDILLFESDSVKIERHHENFMPAFRTPEALMQEGLIRLVKVSSTFTARPAKPEEPDDDDDEVPVKPLAAAEEKPAEQPAPEAEKPAEQPAEKPAESEGKTVAAKKPRAKKAPKEKPTETPAEESATEETPAESKAESAEEPVEKQ